MACSKDEQCGGSKPICTDNACVACTADAQCVKKLGKDPGICMYNEDGRCATPAETAYVQNSTGCSNTIGSGTATQPFCSPVSALANADILTKVLLIRGPVEALVWSPAVATTHLTVVGQNQARFSASGIANEAGVLVTAGDLFARDLTVTSSGGAGVRISGTKTLLHLDRVLVRDAFYAGLRVEAGAGYDVTNSIFLNNGQAGNPVVEILAAPEGTNPHRFAWNTIVDNNGTGFNNIGVKCVSADELVEASLFVRAGTGATDVLMCGLRLNKSVAADQTTADGHLIPASTCRNAIAPADAPTPLPLTDFDGNPRPQEGAYDCGADEFVP